MAIPILNHLDFQKSAEIQNVLLHTEASGNVTSPGTGQIIYDSGTVKFYNGSSWVSVGTATGDIEGVTAGVGLSGGGASGTVILTLDLSELSAVTPASGDSFSTLDSDMANEQRTTVDALATLFAGTGLTASSGVLNVGTLNQDTSGTAAIATTVTLTDEGSDTTCFPVFAQTATGNIAMETDASALTYNAGTGSLAATTFVGALTGNVTGNASGTALTVTQAAQTAITSLGTLTALTVDDVAINGKVITMTGSASDTATLTVGADGTLDIVTTDAGGTEADIQITADGEAALAGTQVSLDSSGGITLDADSGTITFADGGSSLGTITSSGYSGVSATATALATARTIGGTSFDGTANIAVGLAATATALATARTIGGVSFDGTADISLVSGSIPNNAADTSGNAATATLASTVTITDKSDNVNYDVLFGNSTSAVYDDTGALYYNPSTGLLRVPNLSVAGTTTQVDTVTMNAQNAVVFEGATADDFETTLSIVDPTADRTQYLLNIGGYIPLLAAATTTVITSTPEELNTLDGFNGDVTDLNYAKTLYDTGVTGTEFNYLDGVTSAIQTQFGNKQPLDADLTALSSCQSGAATALALLTSTEVAVIDGLTSTTAELNTLDGYTGSVTELNYLDTLHATGVTDTEFDYLDGVTSNIQTQLDATEDASNKITKLLSGDASATTFNIVHSMGTPIVMVQVLDYGNAGSGATYDVVQVEIQRNDDNSVDLIFSAAPSATQDYLVLVSKFPAAS